MKSEKKTTAEDHPIHPFQKEISALVHAHKNLFEKACKSSKDLCAISSMMHGVHAILFEMEVDGLTKMDRELKSGKANKYGKNQGR